MMILESENQKSKQSNCFNSNQNIFMSFANEKKIELSCDCGPITAKFSGKYCCKQCGRILNAEPEIKIETNKIYDVTSHFRNSSKKPQVFIKA